MWDCYSCLKLLCPPSTLEARSWNCEKRLLASSCLAVCLSVRPSFRMEQLVSYLTYFHEMCWVFSKICREISSLIKIWQGLTGTLHEDQCTFMIYLAQFFLESEMFQKKKIVDEMKTHILCSITLWKSCPLRYNAEKYEVPDRPQMTT